MLRYVDSDEADLIWLAALNERPDPAREIALAVRDADRARIDTDNIDRPEILKKFFGALRAKEPTLTSIGAATGLGPKGVAYLLTAERFHPQTTREMGRRGVENLDALRAELQLPALGRD